MLLVFFVHLYLTAFGGPSAMLMIMWPIVVILPATWAETAVTILRGSWD